MRIRLDTLVQLGLLAEPARFAAYAPGRHRRPAGGRVRRRRGQGLMPSCNQVERFSERLCRSGHGRAAKAARRRGAAAARAPHLQAPQRTEP